MLLVRAWYRLYKAASWLGDDAKWPISFFKKYLVKIR